MKVRMHVEGGDQLVRRLQMAAEEVAKEHMREAVKQGAELIKDQMVANAKEIAVTGTLAKSIQLELRRQTKARVEVAIGPDETGWYGRLVEDGHRVGRLTGYFRRREGGRRYRIMQWKGQVPPHPWARTAFESKYQAAQEAIETDLRRRLQRLKAVSE